MKKFILPVIAIAVAAIAAVIIAVSVGGKEEVYRLIKVNSFEGEVAVWREENIDVFNGLQLISEDEVEVGDESLLELLADSDKYIVAEANTAFVLNSTGTEKSGSITIDLLYGSSLIAIDNKLPEGSEFVVNTPNAALSVRGTVFHVIYDPETETTTVEVTEGVVEVVSDEGTQSIEAGGKCTVVGGENDEAETETTVSTDSPADEELPTPVSGKAINDDDWPGLLKGGADYNQLTYLLEIASRCEYANKDDCLNDALYLMCCDTYKTLPYTVTDKLEDGSTVYDVTELNSLFSFLTEDTISEENLNPGINQLDEDRLICTADLLTADKITSTGIYSSCYGESG